MDVLRKVAKFMGWINPHTNRVDEDEIVFDIIFVGIVGVLVTLTYLLFSA